MDGYLKFKKKTLEESALLFVISVEIMALRLRENKNRFIGFNLRQIQDIIDYSNIYKIEGAIIFLDFSKAFDSLEWDFMLSTLKHYGFNYSYVT
jgi:muramoyltetrapeptide carboxypeptidase LdcA involved in peptidoglycan recycling